MQINNISKPRFVKSSQAQRQMKRAARTKEDPNEEQDEDSDAKYKDEAYGDGMPAGGRRGRGKEKESLEERDEDGQIKQHRTRNHRRKRLMRGTRIWKMPNQQTTIHRLQPPNQKNPSTRKTTMRSQKPIRRTQRRLRNPLLQTKLSVGPRREKQRRIPERKERLERTHRSRADRPST